MTAKNSFSIGLSMIGVLAGLVGMSAGYIAAHQPIQATQRPWSAATSGATGRGFGGDMDVPTYPFTIYETPTACVFVTGYPNVVIAAIPRQSGVSCK